MKTRYDIYIIELTAGGHRITFLKYLTDYIKSLNLSVCVITLQETIDSGSFDSLSIPLTPLIPVGTAHSEKSVFDWLLHKLPGKKLSSQILLYRSIKNCLKSLEPNRGVVFPTLQAAGGIPLGIIGKGYPHPWTGVVMAPAAHLRDYAISSAHHSIEILLQKFAYRRMIKHSNCLRISSFDSLFADWIDSHKVVASPDPVELFTDYDSITPELTNINISNDILIVVVGTIDKRKNIAKLANALTSLPHNRYHLLIAGSLKDKQEIQSPAIKSLIEKNKATVITRRLGDRELDYCFHRADVVWSGNLRTYGSSGAVVRGGAHEKPVITMSGSVMGHVLKSAGGGPIINMSSEADITQILLTLEDPDSRKKYGLANKSLFSDNHWQDYAKTVLEPLVNQ